MSVVFELSTWIGLTFFPLDFLIGPLLYFRPLFYRIFFLSSSVNYLFVSICLQEKKKMLKSTEQQGKRLFKLFWFSSKKPGRLFHMFAWNRKWIKLNLNWIQVSSLRYTDLDSRGEKLLRLPGNDGEHLEWNVKPPHTCYMCYIKDRNERNELLNTRETFPAVMKKA